MSTRNQPNEQIEEDAGHSRLGLTRRQLLATGGGMVGAAAGMGLLQTQPTLAARPGARRSVTSSATKGPQMYMLAVGKNQGAFTGDGKGPTNRQHLIEVLEFRFGLVAPYDSATGHASGRVNHNSVTIAKEVGPSTPEFLQALTTHEMLTAVTLQFYVPKPTSGEVIQTYQIVLTTANVVSVNQFIAELQTLENPTAYGAANVVEEISFTYQIAAVDWVPTSKATLIEWSSVT